jgi:proteasome lid subunit RPN8/RPN11
MEQHNGQGNGDSVHEAHRRLREALGRSEEVKVDANGTLRERTDSTPALTVPPGKLAAGRVVESGRSRIVFSDRALSQIRSETAAHPDTETGGILVGTVRDGTFYVLESSDPGYNGLVRSAAYFEYDHQYAMHQVAVMTRLYRERVDLLGLWHRHPGSLDRFSQTDDGTNQMFAELCPHGALSLLVNVDPTFRLTSYVVRSPLEYERVTLVDAGDRHLPEALLRYGSSADIVLSTAVQTAVEEAASRIITAGYEVEQSFYRRREGMLVVLRSSGSAGQGDKQIALFVRGERNGVVWSFGGRDCAHTPTILVDHARQYLHVIPRANSDEQLLGLVPPYTRRELERARKRKLKEVHPDLYSHYDDGELTRDAVVATRIVNDAHQRLESQFQEVVR